MSATCCLALSVCLVAQADVLERIENASEIAGQMTVQILTTDFNGKKWSHKTGAGTIINKEGVVVTCSHVLGEIERVRVRRSDGKTFAAEILGRYPEHDLAILKIAPPGDLEVAKEIHEGLVEENTSAVCVGFPKGKRDACLAKVGNYRRDVGAGVVQENTPVLTFQGAIAPGYSGGPLMDLDGRLLGVVVAMTKTQPTIGVAIPATVVLQDLQRIKETNTTP